MNKAKAAMSTRKTEMPIVPFAATLNASTEYVNGKKRATTCNEKGVLSNKMKVPERKTMGNLRKFDNIWASGTHFA